MTWLGQVSYSAVLFYGYVGVVGLALWAVLKYFKSAIGLAQIWCTYGARRPYNLPATCSCAQSTAFRLCSLSSRFV